MGLLDVSDVLLDPDFMDDGLVCVRHMETVGDNGRVTTVDVQTPFSATVTSHSGDMLEIMAGAVYVRGSIVVTTIFHLTDGDENTSADTVIWQGRRYTVKDIDRYNHFGGGFVSAICEPQSLQSN